MATIKQQRERLEALMAVAPGITGLIDRYKDDKVAIKDSELPGVIVYRAGRASHEIDGDDYFSTRLWLIWVIVQEIKNLNRDSKRDADDAAEDLLDPIIRYLNKNRTLGLDGVDNKLDGTQGITIRDDGVKEFQRGLKRYSALPILIDVGTASNPWRET